MLFVHIFQNIFFLALFITLLPNLTINGILMTTMISMHIFNLKILSLYLHDMTVLAIAAISMNL